MTKNHVYSLHATQVTLLPTLNFLTHTIRHEIQKTWSLSNSKCHSLCLGQKYDLVAMMVLWWFEDRFLDDMVSENIAFSAQNKTLTANSNNHVQWSKLAGYFLDSKNNSSSNDNDFCKYVQWSKLAGYFLNSKRNSDGWEEVSLDYDLLSYKVLISTKIRYQLFILHYTTCPLTRFWSQQKKISIIHSSLYDLPSYKLTNLSCGSVYSFNLIAHNIAGRSKPRWVFFSQEWELKNCKKKRGFKML